MLKSDVYFLFHKFSAHIFGNLILAPLVKFPIFCKLPEFKQKGRLVIQSMYSIYSYISQLIPNVK